MESEILKKSLGLFLFLGDELIADIGVLIGTMSEGSTSKMEAVVMADLVSSMKQRLD